MAIYARKKYNQFRKWGMNRKWSLEFSHCGVFLTFMRDVFDWMGVWCTISIFLAWLEREGFSVRGGSKWKLKNNRASMQDNIGKMLSCLQALQLERDWAFRRLREVQSSKNLGGRKRNLHSKLCSTTAWLDLVSQLSSRQLCKVTKSCCLWKKGPWADCCSAVGLLPVSVRAGHEGAL